MTLNYLGKYDNLSLLWEAHPNGGIEGEYCYVGDQLFVWDKYENNWVEGSAEALDIVPSEQPERESNNGLNCIGCFESEQQLWSQHPQGGVEGDYVVIAGKEYIWDKYNKEWREATEEDAAHFTAVIVQDEAYEYSRLAITFMGSFEDVSQIWKVYPQGGIEGGYIYLGEDKYIWDKYSYSWKPFEPTESSKLRPIDVTYTEGVVAYSEDYINYIGTFDNLDQVWEMYPNGGKDGDYILVNGERLKWNKYTSNWGEDESGDTSPARSVATIYGDLHVFNDLVIGEGLYARILEELSKKQWVQDNFTTKQWLLDQNYARQEWVLDQYKVLQDWVLSKNYTTLDEVTSDVIMQRIVADNSTITIRDGKLVVIGGGGGAGGGSSTPSDIYIIKKGEVASLTDQNVFSALRVDDEFLSKYKGGVVKEQVSFDKGISIGDVVITYDSEAKALCVDGSLYSLGGITAGGVGSDSGGGGGGTSYNRLDSWANYGSDKSGWVLSALLGKDLDDRVSALANAGYITQSALAPYALRSEIPSLEGYATLDALNTLSQTVVNFKSLFDSMFEKDIDGNIHAKLSLWSSGGITAGGVGSGGSGGGISYNRLDSWADYSADKAGYVLSAALGKDLDNRVSALANAGYITASYLAPYALRSEIPSLVGYATQSWVGENYLSKSGGKLVYSGAQGIEAERTDGAPSHIMFIGLVNGASRQLGGFGMNGYNDPVYVNPNGIRHKVLTAENYTDYALSVNGGTVNGSVYMNGWFLLGNSQPIAVADTDGVYQAALYLSGGNNFSIGYGTSVVGKRRTLLFGNIIEFKSNGGEDSTLVLNADRTATFSSTVSAPSFIGNLTGTADKASTQAVPYSNRDVNLWDIGNRTARYFALGDTAQNTPSGAYALGSILMEYSWDTNAGFQMISSNAGNTLLYRSRWGGTFKDWREIAFTDSNVASATKLATPRTIWGQSFDGSNNISGELLNVTTIKGKTGKGVYLYNPYNDYPANSGDLSKAVMIGTAPSVYGLGIWGQNTGNIHAQVGRSDGGVASYNLILQQFGGNVTIGGVAADEKLHVYGNGKFTGALLSQALRSAGISIGCDASGVASDNFAREINTFANKLYLQYRGGDLDVCGGGGTTYLGGALEGKTANFTSLTAPAVTTNSLTIGGATLTYDSANEALCINGNMYALGGITAGGAGISTYSSLEARVARLEQQLNIS